MDASGEPTSTRRLGRYLLVQRIKEHGQGIVYHAIQDQPRRTVAVKVLKSTRPSPQQVALFRQEIETLGKLQHPGIATIFEGDAVEEPSASDPARKQVTYFIAMELVTGASHLTDYVREKNLTLGQALKLFAEVARTLQFVHDNQTVHRDIKPSNILVDAEGRSKLIDFGLAWDRTSVPDPILLAMSSRPVGTPAYMSPEVCASPDKITPQADIYGLGLMLLEYLLGEPAVVVGTFSELPDREKIIEGVSPAVWRRLRDVPAPLLAVVRRACNPLATGRYGRASDLAEDLLCVADGRLPRKAGKTSARERLAGKCAALNRWPWLTIPFAAMCGCLAASAVSNYVPVHSELDYSLNRSIVYSRSLAPGLKSTRIVLADLPSLGLPEIANASGYPAYAAGDVIAGRYPAARMAERLAEAGARAVALDYFFGPPRPDRSAAGTAATTRLAESLTRIKAIGMTEVVISEHFWHGMGGTDPALRGAVASGVPIANPVTRPTNLTLARFSVTTGKLSPGLALQSAGAYLAPHWARRYQLGRGGTALDIYFDQPASGPVTSRMFDGAIWTLWTLQGFNFTGAAAEHDLAESDLTAEVLVDVPDTEELKRTSIDPVDILYRWDLAKLKQEVDGKLVIIGTSGADDRINYPGGALQGAVFNAVAADRVANDAEIVPLQQWRLLWSFAPPLEGVLSLMLGLCAATAAVWLGLRTLAGVLATWALLVWPLTIVVAIGCRVLVPPWASLTAVVVAVFAALVFARPSILQRMVSRPWLCAKSSGNALTATRPLVN